jgi:hypothetical protein
MMQVGPRPSTFLFATCEVRRRQAASIHRPPDFSPAAVIDARLASRVGRQMRRDPSELRIRQPYYLKMIVAGASPHIGSYG